MKKNKSLVAAVVVGALALAIVGALPAEADSSQTDPVVWLAEGCPKVPGAYSVLMRNDDGVAVRVHSRKLPKGAYTMWWVIFNNPQFCSDPGCGEKDFPPPLANGDPNVAVSIQFATGFIVPSNNGKVRADAGLELDEETKFAAGDSGIASAKLQKPMTAEIHLVLRDHGPVDLAIIHNQISEFDHTNNPNFPDFLTCGAPPNDECTDVQAALHPAP
jgi:hypothetical protein